MAWQIIKRFLANPMPWLLAGLLGFAVYYYTVADRYEAERDKAEMRADALKSAIDWQRDQIMILQASLAEREALIQADREDIALKLDSLNALERNDEPTRDWSAEPLPAAVGDWLRKLPEDGSAEP